MRLFLIAAAVAGGTLAGCGAGDPVASADTNFVELKANLAVCTETYEYTYLDAYTGGNIVGYEYCACREPVYLEGVRTQFRFIGFWSECKK